MDGAELGVELIDFLGDGFVHAVAPGLESGGGGAVVAGPEVVVDGEEGAEGGFGDVVEGEGAEVAGAIEFHIEGIEQVGVAGDDAGFEFRGFGELADAVGDDIEAAGDEILGGGEVV